MVLGWGKKAESNPDSDEEMSMEEILASIRKYVSTDQQTQPAVQKEQQPTLYSQPQHVPTTPRLDDEEVSPYKINGGSDRREGVSSLATPQATRSIVQEQTMPHPDHSYNATTPQENTTYTYSQEQKSDYKQELPSSVFDHPVTASMVSRTLSEVPNNSGSYEQTEGLLSTGTMNATSQAFSKLVESTRSLSEKASTAQNTPSMTLDQLIADLARPMIKSWVDQNLSKLVESMVAKEIEKITKNMR